MKKLILSLTFFVCVALTVSAQVQTAIPNGNFESIFSRTYDYPANYPYVSNPDIFLSNYPFNVNKTTDAYHGNYAVSLKTIAVSSFDTVFGFFLNVPPNDGDVTTWTGGFPYDEAPTGIRGYYKYNVASSDSAVLFVIFHKATANVGFYFYKIGGIKNSYTLFDFTFNPPLSVTPDSVVIGFASSDFTKNSNGQDGSLLLIDSVSFKGVNAQPALMNGDFELWQSHTISKPEYWYIGDRWHDGAINIINDSYKGNYAVELITRPGENNGVPEARGTQISTGYWDENCNCMAGGYPFSNTIDTLELWYKYSPSGNDSAVVAVLFKKSGSIVTGFEKILHASSSYQYVTIPFNISVPIDTAIVIISSSYWNNTELSFIGSKLIVDEVQFKSQPLCTGILNNVDNKLNTYIYPNPSSGKFYINNLPENTQNINIYNTYGQLVFSLSNPVNKYFEIDLTGFPKGIYFLNINNANNKPYSEKLIVK